MFLLLLLLLQLVLLLLPQRILTSIPCNMSLGHTPSSMCAPTVQPVPLPHWFNQIQHA
jgi:hypothetical protein